MSNYFINITDVGNGSWTLTRVQRAGTAASGGTDLTPPRANGDTTNILAFQGLGDAIQKGQEVCLADRTLNG